MRAIEADFAVAGQSALVVIARLDQAIQYTRSVRCLLGHPVEPGDDNLR
jgi:hypothetical protein